uniref:Uncharacterized protein n=1 Tax=Setaria viridis TaxID=4556 RepID=A0A4U6VDQ1_SETVI|nr:hypothetical protein SEVIR_3G268325v2 [Setaria viridis]
MPLRPCQRRASSFSCLSIIGKTSMTNLFARALAG